MQDLFTNGPFQIVLPAVAALSCFVSALVVAAIILRNKGAKINVAWGLIALGLTAFGVVHADRALAGMGWSNASAWHAVAEALGALLILAGVLYRRRLFNQLLK